MKWASAPAPTTRFEESPAPSPTWKAPIQSPKPTSPRRCSIGCWIGGSEGDRPMDAIKSGFYILLLLPGFIFVQTRDYHLLREAKGQFEKTLEIILWSAIIWVGTCTFPLELP